METFVKGKYRRQIFQSEKGYTIGLFKVQEASNDLDRFIGKTITFTGYLPDLNEIDTYLLKGKVVLHPKYGEQFDVDEYEKILPEENDAIVEFLCSGIFKGVGRKRAEKIVQALGKETLPTILKQPSNLILIEGVNASLANKMHETLLSYETSYEAMLSLTEKGFSMKDASMIYSKYKEETLPILEEDIYRPYYDFKEISFKKIDFIALKSGISKEDLIRIKAFIYYGLEEISFALGNTYCSREELYQLVCRTLGTSLDAALFDKACYELVRALKIVILDEKYALKTLFDDECLVASRFRLLAHQKDETYELENTLASIEQESGIHYNVQQKEAIQSAILSPISIITGGPGTGKTTIIEAIVKLYQQHFHYSDMELSKHLVLLAPTGRAAKRMREKTRLTSSTIHRFLKWNKELDTFSVNEYNKSDAKFVIIDESSMVDVSLMASLLRGLSSSCKILLVGDSDQLPSVGAGNVLQDAISSQEIKTVFLNILYRQGEDSSIISFAHGIREGKFLEDTLTKEKDLVFEEADASSILSRIVELSKGFQKEDSFQVLVPMYKTICGIDVINQALQQIFNPKAPHKKELLIGDTLYREGDKVIQLLNLPDENIYNGDIGFITNIKTKEKQKEVWIDFDGNVVKYTPSSFHTFKSAWAISIHKAQGSEFDVVILPMTLLYRNMLYRKLFYTGVTRAKKKLILVGEKKAMATAIKNTNALTRKTFLKEFLENGIM